MLTHQLLACMRERFIVVTLLLCLFVWNDLILEITDNKLLIIGMNLLRATI